MGCPQDVPERFPYLPFWGSKSSPTFQSTLTATTYFRAITVLKLPGNFCPVLIQLPQAQGQKCITKAFFDLHMHFESARRVYENLSQSLAQNVCFHNTYINNKAPMFIAPTHDNMKSTENGRASTLPNAIYLFSPPPLQSTQYMGDLYTPPPERGGGRIHGEGQNPPPGLTG